MKLVISEIDAEAAELIREALRRYADHESIREERVRKAMEHRDSLPGEKQWWIAHRRAMAEDAHKNIVAIKTPLDVLGEVKQEAK